MAKTLLRFMGLVALVGESACLPTYEASSAQTNLPPVQATGPQMAQGTDVSTSPTAVRPEAPSQGVTVWDQNGDPSMVAAQMADVGPLDVAARKHSCMKMKFDTLGRLLASHGVDMTSGGASILPVTANTNCMPLSLQTFTPDRNTFQRINYQGDFVDVTQLSERLSFVSQIAEPAKYIYCNAAITLGLPEYGARIAEATAQSTASGTKLFDLFASAAPEIVSNLMNAAMAPACQVNGQASVLFNADNTCNEAGITCLQGYPATADQVALCTRLVQQASATATTNVTVTTFGTGTDETTSEIVTIPVSSRQVTVQGLSPVDTGKRLAVAAILSAVHSCE